MSFSTPSMNPELSERSTNKQNNLFLPRINTPFSACNLQQPHIAQMAHMANIAQMPQMQQMSQMQQMPQTAFTQNMPSPWHTAQFLPVQQPCMQTTWATAAAPPIEIEVHESAAKTAVDTKVSWTSAEQLADAIFPTKIETMTNAIEPLHVGLLNHKEQITNQQLDIAKQHNGLLNHKNVLDSQHLGLLNHKTAIDNQHIGLLNHKEVLDSQHLGLLSHKNAIENLLQMNADMSNKIDTQTNSLSTHQILHSAFDTKYNNLQKTLKEMQDSSGLKLKKLDAKLQNHEEAMLHHTDVLRNNKFEIDKTSMALSECQRKTDDHYRDLISLDSRLHNLERKMTTNHSTAQKLENLTHQKLQDLHERFTAVESSTLLHSKKIDSMLATNDTQQVQFQVLGPRRR